MDLVVSRYGDSSCLSEETMRFCEELTAVRGVFERDWFAGQVSICDVFIF